MLPGFLKRPFFRWLNDYIEETYSAAYIGYLDAHGAIKPQLTALDIGAGAGGFVRDLALRGLDAEGIEPVTERVAAAASPRIRQAAFGPDFRPSKTYDLITLNQMIFFLGKAPDVLRQLKGMLRPGGMVFIVTADAGFDTHKQLYPDHILYTKDDYFRFAKEIGYDVLGYDRYQASIGVAFNDGMAKGLLRIAAYATGLARPVAPHSAGNHTYILLRST